MPCTSPVEYTYVICTRKPGNKKLKVPERYMSECYAGRSFSKVTHLTAVLAALITLVPPLFNRVTKKLS